MGARVAFHTLGCKLNFAETSMLSRAVEKQGYGSADFDGEADIYVLNTCSVTDHADRRTAEIVRGAMRRNPNGQVVVIGCYAQLKPREILELPGVSMVLGAKDKFRLPELLPQLLSGCEKEAIGGHVKEATVFHPAYSLGDRTRSFLKVQDGCDYFCAFCTIPLARGRSRSAEIRQILDATQILADNAIKEVVLTGVNIGDFRATEGEQLIDLLKALDADAPATIERFRISSIEPNLLTDDIIEFCAQSQRFVPHFHIPMQSGSDVLLSAMRRRYRKDLYAGRIYKIKQAMPNACIGADVIVGFPGETEEDFEETVGFIKSLGINYLHVFTYSERPNTTAVRLKDKVLHRLRTQRRDVLRDLSEQLRLAFYQANIGQKMNVLWEEEARGAEMYGFTPNYIRVSRPFDERLKNTIQSVELGKMAGDKLTAIDIK